MPTLSLRRVGMSHLVEGLAALGPDGEALLSDWSAAFGPAVAAMGPPPIDALLVDQKVGDSAAIRERLEAWVKGRGYGFTSWSEDGLSACPSATLHFHRD